MTAAHASFLDVDGQPVPVWFHAPAEVDATSQSKPRMGVLMCPAWGREEASSHGPWRTWAQALAQAGHPAMRLDYPGEGDAWGAAEEASQLSLWVRAALVAVDHLVARTGVRHVCIMGLRWGAVVAWQAARQHPRVSALLAVAPVVRGRTYVRELAALQAASSGDDEALARAGCFQSGGFVLQAQEVARWSAIDLLADSKAAGEAGEGAATPLGALQRVMVLDREDLPAADKWIAALQSCGVTADCLRVPGYADIMADPHHASLPEAWVQASLGCLQSALPEQASDQVGMTDAAAVDLAGPAVQAELSWAPWAAQAQADVHEPTLQRGPPAVLSERFVQWPDTPAVGVMTLLAGTAGPASGQAILLLNAGSTHHIGPNRLWVELARNWAAQGHMVLRVDLAGLGESEPRPACPRNQTYPHAAVEDVRSVVAWLSKQPKVQHITAGGLCAGGYHALAAVRAGVPLQAILMVNPLVYLDAEGMDLGDASGVAEHQAQSAMLSYKQALLNPAKWRKLLGGQVRLGVLAQVLQRRANAWLKGCWREVTRAVGMPLRGDLARVFRDAMDAGVAVHLFFAAADPGLPLLQEELGSMMSRLGRRPEWHCTVLPSGDHVFTRWSDRMHLLHAVQSTVPGPIVR